MNQKSKLVQFCSQPCLRHRCKSWNETAWVNILRSQIVKAMTSSLHSLLPCPIHFAWTAISQVSRMALNSVSYQSQVSRHVYSIHGKVIDCAEYLKLASEGGPDYTEGLSTWEMVPWKQLLMKHGQVQSITFPGNIKNSPWGLAEKKDKQWRNSRTQSTLTLLTENLTK